MAHSNEKFGAGHPMSTALLRRLLLLEVVALLRAHLAVQLSSARVSFVIFHVCFLVFRELWLCFKVDRKPKATRSSVSTMQHLARASQSSFLLAAAETVHHLFCFRCCAFVLFSLAAQ